MQVGLCCNHLNPKYILCITFLLLNPYITVLLTGSSVSDNIFDNLPSFQAPTPSDLQGELCKYLDSDPIEVSDALAWWHEH